MKNDGQTPSYDRTNRDRESLPYWEVSSAAMEKMHAFPAEVPPVLTPQSKNRHAEIDARFRAHQEARLQARKIMKAKEKDFKDPKESVGYFWTDFRRAYDDVVQVLNALLSEEHTETNISSGPGRADNVDDTLSCMDSKIKSLGQLVSNTALSLPPYDMRRAQEETESLRSKLEEVRTALMPRKKFTFAGRRRTASATSSLMVSEGHGRTGMVAEAGGRGGSTPRDRGAMDKRPATPTTPLPAVPPKCAADDSLSAPGVSNLSGAMPGFGPAADANFTFGQLTSEGTEGPPKDLLLRDLTRCTVSLLSPLHFLRCENLRDCKLLCGPVAGPVYLQDCVGCTLYVAGRQLRVHRTYDTTLYVHTVAGPIIEDCDRLRFGPWALAYPGREEQVEEAGLGGTENAWREVKDFKWLRAQASPHWQVLPQEAWVREEVDGEGWTGGGSHGGGRKEEKEEEEEEEL